MGSHDIFYKGCCSDRVVQEELLKYLRILDNQCISLKVRERLDWIDSRIDWIDSRIHELEPAHSARLYYRLSRKRDTLATVGIIQSFDQTLEGNLILNIDVALDRDQLLREARERGFKKKDETYLHLSSLGVHGIELYLFNPPLSFVFLACPEIPALHGCMVNLQSKAEASHYYMKKFEDADWFIHVPCITLRNYLFDWTLSLLNWVGYFFVPNMGRGHTPYYKEKMRKLGPRELAKKAEMQRLMKWLDMEIDDFLNM